MSRKWTGQDIFLLGAAVCTLCLMYITIIFPTSSQDSTTVEGIEEYQQEQQFVEVNSQSSNEEYAYKYQSGVENHGESN
ncbi:hypothetical protein [Alkalicoccobacillus porphyridii]|uniref:Uncharacterized protein n=1 Tax=Alkalicoccobacillus porphyridii TaxID=2597270 RepID=A0A553ZYH8_9BACI|nr:hypothetical protein [Alkalicoccobacillus porphyridii]TSB46500.1 hypothetical protein FN960_11930 [Alkalicoccobacillus porphyridii]